MRFCFAPPPSRHSLPLAHKSAMNTTREKRVTHILATPARKGVRARAGRFAPEPCSRPPHNAHMLCCACGRAAERSTPLAPRPPWRTPCPPPLWLPTTIPLSPLHVRLSFFAAAGPRPPPPAQRIRSLQYCPTIHHIHAKHALLSVLRPSPPPAPLSCQNNGSALRAVLSYYTPPHLSRLGIPSPPFLPAARFLCASWFLFRSRCCCVCFDRASGQGGPWDRRAAGGGATVTAPTQSGARRSSPPPPSPFHGSRSSSSCSPLTGELSPLIHHVTMRCCPLPAHRIRVPFLCCRCGGALLAPAFQGSRRLHPL